MLLDGRQIGHYRLLRRIGDGGMGEVYLAADMAVERQVAIKVIRTDISLYSTQEEFREAVRLFNREANAIARLDHPHILPLFECGEENFNGTTFTYLVMPYRPEGSLADLLRQGKHSKQFSTPDVAHIVLQASDALEHAHAHNIIHRDVKPSNFLLRNRNENSGRPDLLLADFGIAKLNTTSDNTTSTTIRGTATYMAPEQWEDHPVPQTDQYALAVMAYELLTGRPPFLGNQQQLMYQHFHAQPKPASTINPQISQDIDAVLLRALAKNPGDRFASISAFAHAFQEAVQESNNIRLTLTISQLEARTGTTRTLILTEEQHVTVHVPAGVTQGQVIRLEGRGRPPQYPGDLPGALILTISIIQVKEAVSLENSHTIEQTTPAFEPNKGVTPLKHRQRPSRSKVLLLICVLILLGASSGLFFVTTIKPPGPNISVTATFRAATSAAQAHATTTSQAATGTAQANATLTAISQDTTATAQANATIQAIQTVLATQTPTYSVQRTLILSDPLDGKSNDYNWELSSDSHGACAFNTGAYQVSESLPGTFYYCIAQAVNYSNIVYQVQMTILTGDQAGIIFRADESIGDYYYFSLSRDGSYKLSVYTHNKKGDKPLASGPFPAINTGKGQPNLIAIQASDSDISLYVNNQYVTTMSDATYSRGQIGVAAYDVDSPTDVIFSNAEVWSL